MLEEKNLNEERSYDPSWEEDDCNVTVYQDLDVCVPVSVEPYIKIGEPIVDCLEDPCIKPGHQCSSNKNGTCKFTIMQRLCVTVPIEFKAKARSGPASVCCFDVSDEGCSICDCEGKEEFESHTLIKPGCALYNLLKNSKLFDNDNE